MTKEELINNGWIEIKNDPIFLFEKKLKNNNPFNKDDTDISLVVHRFYNDIGIGMMLPNGGLVELNINNLNDVSILENMVLFYDGPY